MASWEEMAEQVLVIGRPGDVQSAADGWDQLLKASDEVKTSLEKNVDDLSQGWKGPAYEAFKTHIKGIAKQLGDMNAQARVDDGIVTALSNAAHKLEQAQNDMPIPAVCTGDIIAARNMSVTIPAGFFQAKVSSSFMSSFANWTPAQWEYQVMDWFNDQTDDARKVYDRVQGQYQDQTYRTPGSGAPVNSYDHGTPVNTNVPSGGGGGVGGAGKLPGGGLPKSGSLATGLSSRSPAKRIWASLASLMGGGSRSGSTLMTSGAWASATWAPA